MGSRRFLIKPLAGHSGFLSRTFHATRKGDSRGYVLKVGTKDPRALEFSRKVRAFRREAIAYGLLRPISPKVTPACLGSAYTRDGSDGLLVLGRIARSRTGDQVAGLTWNDLSSAVRSIGIVHASLWRRPRGARLKLLPLHQYNRAHETKTQFSRFMKAFRPQLSLADQKTVPSIPQTVSLALRFAKQRPTTLVHGDLRADNLLFTQDQVFIVDWQLATWGLGTFDLARLIGGSTRHPLSAPEQKKLVTLWHRTLRRGGVRRYSLEEAWQDYRIGVALSLSIPITNGPTLASLSARGKRIARRMIHRFFRNGREFGLL